MQVQPAKGLVHSPLCGKLRHLTERVEREKRLHGLYAVSQILCSSLRLQGAAFLNGKAASADLTSRHLFGKTV